MAEITPGIWNLDASHAELGFTVRHAGISKVRGKFNIVEGQLDVKENVTDSSVNVKIDASSINTAEENRDGHLKSADFFDVEQYPNLTFVSKEIRDYDGEDFVLVGDLTIRDVTKEVELEAEFGGQVVDAFGATRAGFEAKGEISRKEFGLTWNAAMETGGFLVGDKIKLEIDASFVKADEGAEG